MKRLLFTALCIFNFHFLLQAKADFPGHVSEKFIAGYYIKKGELHLSKGEFKKAIDYYKKALDYAISPKVIAGIEFKLCETYIKVPSKTIDTRIYNLNFACIHYLKIFKKDTSQNEQTLNLKSILLDSCRNHLDNQNTPIGEQLFKLSENTYRVSSDSFDFMQFTRLSEQLKPKPNWNLLLPLIIRDTLAINLNRRKLFYQMLTEYFSEKTEYDFPLKMEQQLSPENRPAFTEIFNTGLNNKWNSLCNGINLDTIDLNNISIEEFERYYHINSILRERNVKINTSLTINYLALCCLYNCSRSYSNNGQDNPVWEFKNKYEHLLPKGKVDLVRLNNLYRYYMDSKNNDDFLEKGINPKDYIGYKLQIELTKDAFYQLLADFYWDKFDKTPKYNCIEHFEYDSINKTDGKLEILKLSKYNEDLVYNIASVAENLSPKEIKTYSAGQYFTPLKNKLIKLFNHASDLNQLDSTLKIYKRLKELEIEDDISVKQKLTKHYYQIIEKLKTPENFSLAYQLYAVLNDYYHNDFAFLKSKQKLIKKDYETNYITSELNDTDCIWSGNIEQCLCGKLPDSFYKKSLNQLAFIRRLAELPDKVEFNPKYNELAQEAALIMAANNTLNHFPDKNYKCFSQKGFQGASSSNLCGGSLNIMGYIQDSGTDNKPVGHRRWILNPYNSLFGFGAVFKINQKKYESEYGSAEINLSNITNALYVTGMNNDKKALNKDYSLQPVAWPMEGFFPEEYIYNRWSFSLDKANFSKSKVELKLNSGKTIYPPVVSTQSGYALNTIVWEFNLDEFKLKENEFVEIKITGIKADNEAIKEYTYTVYPFDLKNK